MRHRRRIKHFSRKSGPRKALLRGLIVSLVEHGRIMTTVEKAKELRRHVERAITLGKNDDLASRRLLLSRIPNEKTVGAIVGDLSKRFADRPGGYTRVIKIGRRPGDTAEMAFIEFVDFDYTKASGDVGAARSASKRTTKKSTNDAPAASKKITKSAKTSKLVAAKKKAVKKIQKKSRQAARA